MKLCDLDTARALQSMGYDGKYTYIYRPDGTLGYLIDYIVLHEPVTENYIPTPRIDDAAYFIRDKYNRFIEIRINLDNRYCWGICDTIHPTNDTASEEFGLDYLSFDNALEAAVKQVIEIIQKQ